MVVAGEASGDLHGANLVKAMKTLRPALTYCGMGGTAMEQAGVERLYDAAKVSVVGFFEVITHLKDILRAQRTLRNRLTHCRPQLLILIDFPDFNFLLAKKAKKLGIPVFYYISPQVWAWRSGRVKTIAKLVDRLGVILPFEEAFYRDRGVDATYVGHPLLDTVKATMSKQDYLSTLGCSAQHLIGILPGSRIKEIKRLLPIFMASAQMLQERCDERLLFVVPCASSLSPQDLYEHGIKEYEDKLQIKIIEENRYEMMAASDAVIAASGTVTLELLLLNTPVVVAYRLAPLTYLLGKLLVRINYFSLINLIAGKMVVPELLQKDAHPKRISDELYSLLFEKTIRENTTRDFQEVRKKLGNRGASLRAAELALTLIPGSE